MSSGNTMIMGLWSELIIAIKKFKEQVGSYKSAPLDAEADKVRGTRQKSSSALDIKN
jgi:hypothetical protein